MSIFPRMYGYLWINGMFSDTVSALSSIIVTFLLLSPDIEPSVDDVACLSRGHSRLENC